MPRPKAEAPTFSLSNRGGRYYIGWWEDGAARRISCRTTELAEARRFLAEFKAARGTPQPPEAPTIGVILEGYEKDRSAHVSSPTLGYCCRQLRKHLADLPADLLTKREVQNYCRDRRKAGRGGAPAKHAPKPKPLSDGTLIRELVTLRAALSWAVKERWIPSAPHVAVPSAPPSRDRWLTRQEAERLLAACEAPHIKVFVALALNTAARTGALLDLRWDQIDLAAGLIVLGRGRGNKRRATVPINDVLRPVLVEAMAAKGDEEHVVCFRGGRVASIKVGFRAAARRAMLEGATPHVLRHTAATWMAQGGRPLEEIARFLGNRAEMVEKVYAHHSPDYLRAAAAALAGSIRLPPSSA